MLHALGLISPSLGSTKPCGGRPVEVLAGDESDGKLSKGPGGGVDRCMAGGDVEPSGEVLGWGIAVSSADCSTSPGAPGVGLRPSRNAFAISAAFHLA